MKSRMNAALPLQQDVVYSAPGNATQDTLSLLAGFHFAGGHPHRPALTALIEQVPISSPYLSGLGGPGGEGRGMPCARRTKWRPLFEQEAGHVVE